MFFNLFIPVIISYSCIAAGCNNTAEGNVITVQDSYNKGRLTARPKNNAPAAKHKTGVEALNLDNNKDGFIYVPKGYNKDRPASLAVMLHGAGGRAEHGLSLLKTYADDKNIVLLAPASREATWDIISKDAFDADVIFIDQALTDVFERYNIDTSHIALGGFSDGASYALSLGLSNGDLFTHIIAFSPGFYHTIKKKGKPAVFISHGVNDGVLPIDRCSRRIVPELNDLGYKVDYKEFKGVHEVPTTISTDAVNWFKR